MHVVGPVDDDLVNQVHTVTAAIDFPLGARLAVSPCLGRIVGIRSGAKRVHRIMLTRKSQLREIDCWERDVSFARIDVTSGPTAYVGGRLKRGLTGRWDEITFAVKQVVDVGLPLLINPPRAAGPAHFVSALRPSRIESGRNR